MQGCRFGNTCKFEHVREPQAREPPWRSQHGSYIPKSVPPPLLPGAYGHHLPGKPSGDRDHRLPQKLQHTRGDPLRWSNAKFGEKEAHGLQPGMNRPAPRTAQAKQQAKHSDQGPHEQQPGMDRPAPVKAQAKHVRLRMTSVKNPVTLYEPSGAVCFCTVHEWQRLLQLWIISLLIHICKCNSIEVPRANVSAIFSRSLVLNLGLAQESSREQPREESSVQPKHADRHEQDREGQALKKRRKSSKKGSDRGPTAEDDNASAGVFFVSSFPPPPLSLQSHQTISHLLHMTSV